ncbi:MAG: putative transport system permease protein [Chthoniobacter sp.]|jgi:ABC-type antimicrobial peptide transport system permease subunit|nr:putative transport system permease protein [Chthoniobacter sp.]
MKNLIAGLSNGFAEVWAHKLRSLLTMTCVFLGVASLVAVMGLLEGLVTSWETWFAEFGGLEKVSIVAEDSVDDQRQILFSTITMQDVESVRRLCRDAAFISPEIYTEALTAHHGKFFKVPVQGVSRDALTVSKYALSQGRFITDADSLGYENVAVLGSAAVDALYERNEKVVGSTVYIKGQPFYVVGVLKRYVLMQEGLNVLNEKNQIVFIPLATMQKKVLGKPELSSLNVKVRQVGALSRVKTQLTNLLWQNHRGKRGYKLDTAEAMMETMHKSRRSYFAVGGGVAAVSLLVGGLGIMNLMLASINERVREIGIRKALGAWGWDIFVQFIAEAITLSLLGGLAGAVFGVGLIKYLQTAMADSSPPILSPNAVIVGFSISVAIGVLSGLYPAVRASKLDPIEALRYE